MSDNTIRTIGQHVFKYLPPEYTEEGAPFLSENKEVEKDGEKVIEYPFLGEGYYFWDNNIHRAHHWGRTHYEGHYKILETPLVLEGGNFLDLVGSRQDIAILIEVMEYMKDIVPVDKLGAFLSGMQKIKSKSPEKWPFSIIRAMNVKTKSKKKPFNHIIGSNMIMDPEIIICFYDKKDINLQKIRIIEKTDDNGR